jgi:hypothetical protein
MTVALGAQTESPAALSRTPSGSIGSPPYTSPRPPNGAVAFNPTEWYAFSDHSPIVATFED